MRIWRLNPDPLYSMSMKNRNIQKIQSHKSVQEDKKINLPEIRKHIISLAMPAMGENMLRMLTMIADTAIVGRLGAEALAIGGLSWAIVFFFIMISFGINHGAVAVISRFVGAKDQENAKKAAGQSLVINFCLGLIMSATMIIFAEKLFKFMGAEPQIVYSGTFYLKVLASTFLADCLMATSNAILRAAGDTKTPMKIVGLSNLLFVFLDLALVYGKFGFPEYGLMGSCIAVSISRIFSFILAFGGLLFGWYMIKLDVKHLLHPNFPMMKRVLNIAWPAMIEQIINSSASLVFIKIITSLGTLSLAINNILLRAESLAFMPGMSISIAASIIVGQSLGEKNKDKAECVAWETSKMGMIVMGTVGASFLTIPFLIVKIFTPDPTVALPTAKILMIIALIEPVQGLLFVLLGVFKGAGDTRTTMRLTTAGMWLLRVPFAYIFAQKLHLGVAGAWAAMCLHIAVITLLSFRHYKSGKWKDITI
jgi:putative MATE family efflux protein